MESMLLLGIIVMTAFLVILVYIKTMKQRNVLNLHSWLQECNVELDRKRERLVAIINPIGGSGNGESIGNLLKDICAELDHELTVHLTQYQGHAAEIAKKLEPSEYDLCICVGGDGMLNEIINGMLSSNITSEIVDEPHMVSFSEGKILHKDDGDIQVAPFLPLTRHARIPLAILPSGTGNGVATSLGAGNLKAALKCIFTSKIKPVDMLDVHVGNSFQMYAALSVSWGLVADADARSETSWRWMGPIRTTLTAVYTMLRNQNYSGKLEFVLSKNQKPPQFLQSKTITRPCTYGVKSQAATETEEWVVVEGEFSLVTVSNLPWLASDILLAPTCELSDGEMALLFIKKTSRLSLLKMFSQAESGQHVTNPVVNMIKCTQVRILPDSYSCGHIVADGELAEIGPVHIRCAQGATKFKVAD